MTFQVTEHPHVRFNPLKGELVIVSPHRMKRPWSGQLEKPDEEERPEFDPTNPLCPGVTRPSGQVTPQYKTTYVFENDFPALLADTPSPEDTQDPLFRCLGARGQCKVMCFSPKSNVTIPLMSLDEIKAVVDTWTEETLEIGSKFKWVQIFENKGEGSSNQHPHCQIWASSFLPNEAAIKDVKMREYKEKFGTNLLMDYASKEIIKQERIVVSNEDWIAVVPFWAYWPYETMILPKKRLILRMTNLTEAEKMSLAEIMKNLTIRYDNLFECSFPYAMGFHGAPTGPDQSEHDYSHWQFHALYLPILLKSATVKKFMGGYEKLANVQRDLTAEQAAEKLRNCSSVHYKLQSKMLCSDST